MALPQVVDPDVVTFYNELLQEGELSPEQTKLLEEIVGKEKVWKKFKSGLHARSMTDRKMDELNKEKKKFEDDYSKKVGELDSLRESLAAGGDLSKQEKATLTAKINSLEDIIHKAKQKSKDFADGDEVLKTLGLDATPSTYVPPVETKKDSSAFDEKALLEKLGSQMNLNARALAKWAVDLRKMEREHFLLTGKEVDPEELFTKLSEKVDDYQGNYYKAFEDIYDIPSLRETKKENVMRAKLEQELEAKYEKKYAEKLLPSEHRSRVESDFYKSIDSTIPADEKPNGSPMGIDNRSETVGEASSFFAKLREKKEAAA